MQPLALFIRQTSRRHTFPHVGSYVRHFLAATCRRLNQCRCCFVLFAHEPACYVPYTEARTAAESNATTRLLLLLSAHNRQYAGRVTRYWQRQSTINSTREREKENGAAAGMRTQTTEYWFVTQERQTKAPRATHKTPAAYTGGGSSVIIYMASVAPLPRQHTLIHNIMPLRRRTCACYTYATYNVKSKPW